MGTWRVEMAAVTHAKKSSTAVEPAAKMDVTATRLKESVREEKIVAVISATPSVETIRSKSMRSVTMGTPTMETAVTLCVERK